MFMKFFGTNCDLLIENAIIACNPKVNITKGLASDINESYEFQIIVCGIIFWPAAGEYLGQK